MARLRLIVFLPVLTLLAACSGTVQISRLTADGEERLPPAVALNDVPFYPQDAYQCGPAALATTLDYSGASTSLEALVERVYLPARHGSLQPEMLAATRSAGRLPYLIDPSLDALLEEVAGGHPVLVLQNLGLGWLPQWHYAVVVGFDLEAGKLTLRSGTIRDYRVSLGLFERTWRRAEHWGFVALRPGELPSGGEPYLFFEALAAAEQVMDNKVLIPAYQSAIQRWPDAPFLGAALGNLYYRQGNLSLARQQFQGITESHPAYAEAHNNLAHILLELGQPEAASRHARMAVNLGGPGYPLFEKTLAATLAAMSPAP
ncbi:MAG: PA2778 family cysteine peptidase [Gammaproteobacteria bacterium]|nr:PA2778 family cysteine peptidase [Pseudomonadales bacterium]MCP5346505.1 PA2778 family cysteine peptidase [Pseudomonadales bacterium]